MSKKVFCVTNDTSFKNLWKALILKKVSAAPVVDKDNKLQGIVTENDLLSYLYPDYSEYVSDLMNAADFDKMESKILDLANIKASKLMCRKVVFTREGTQVMRALSRMIVRRVNQLPVLSEKDKVVGIITKGDIFAALFKEHIHKLDIRRKKKTK